MLLLLSDSSLRPNKFINKIRNLFIPNYIECIAFSAISELFLLETMGVLAPGSVHARPSTQPPIDTGGTFFTCLGGGVNQFLIHFIAISCDSKHFLLFS